MILIAWTSASGQPRGGRCLDSRPPAVLMPIFPGVDVMQRTQQAHAAARLFRPSQTLPQHLIRAPIDLPKKFREQLSGTQQPVAPVVGRAKDHAGVVQHGPGGSQVAPIHLRAIDSHCRDFFGPSGKSGAKRVLQTLAEIAPGLGLESPVRREKGLHFRQGIGRGEPNGATLHRNETCRSVREQPPVNLTGAFRAESRGEAGFDQARPGRLGE